MGAESTFYYPIELHTGAEQGSVLAPLITALPLEPCMVCDLVVILSENVGVFQQGLYVFDGTVWRFLAPMTIVSEATINAYVIKVYVNPVSSITLPDNTQVYKNGVKVTGTSVMLGNSVWVGFIPFIAPPSPPSPDIFNFTAVTDVSGHRVMRVAIGGVTYASADDVSHANLVMGITTSAGLAGTKVPVQSTGELTEPSWNWIPGEPVFCGINGFISQAPPSVGFSLIVGQASAPQTIIVGIKQPIIVGV